MPIYGRDFQEVTDRSELAAAKRPPSNVTMTRDRPFPIHLIVAGFGILAIIFGVFAVWTRLVARRRSTLNGRTAAFCAAGRAHFRRIVGELALAMLVFEQIGDFLRQTVDALRLARHSKHRVMPLIGVQAARHDPRPG